ncbi:MAG: hypothetical protein G3M70_01610 [Candidatus Nitronauta litoralis]|uniref:Uncharacterized protein n=1 Tax=Candidatus Nitronauta litoralis TaxID=2705533 RepID=A0A7T0BUF1_9BACT|nr:MAG: hypothetical protein G3M70_01610 [Candidatus Nitronauta litoralis]
MTTRKITKIICALAIASFLNAGNALAHQGTGHDHRSIPVGWTFDQKVADRIQRGMNEGNETVGLSGFEQKTLKEYGIQVGNRFKTRVGDQMIEVTRTSSGLHIEGPTLGHDDAPQWNLPMSSTHQVIKSSMRAAHPGHDHRHLDFEWVFSLDAQKKIANNLTGNNPSGAIGLSQGEQKMLQRYGIKVGNTFNTLLGGMAFTVQRTSMGLQVLKHVQGMPIAAVPGENVGRY